MTYAKPIRRASHPRRGGLSQELARPHHKARSGRRTGAHQWVFLGPEQICDPSILKTVAALDPHIGLVVRSYGKSNADIAAQVRHLARRQRRLCLTAPHGHIGFGRHIPRWQRAARGLERPISMSVHTASEAVRARKAKANVVFISPVFKTNSHPGAPALGLYQARALARLSGRPPFGLGGVTPKNRALLGPRFLGVAGITAFLKAT